MSDTLLDDVYFILQHRETGQILRQRGTTAGVQYHRPALYVEERYAKGALGHRVANPNDWNIVPVIIVPVEVVPS